MLIRIYAVDKNKVAVRFKEELRVAHMDKSFTEAENSFTTMKSLRKQYLYVDISEDELERMELLMEKDV